MPLGAASPNTVLDSAAHPPDRKAAKKESVEEETAKIRIYQPNKVFQKIKDTMGRKWEREQHAWVHVGSRIGEI